MDLALTLALALLSHFSVPVYHDKRLYILLHKIECVCVFKQCDMKMERRIESMRGFFVRLLLFLLLGFLFNSQHSQNSIAVSSQNETDIWILWRQQTQLHSVSLSIFFSSFFFISVNV